MKTKTVLKATLAGQVFIFARRIFYKKNKQQPPALSLTSIIPNSGKPCPVLTINGTGFSCNVSDNVVTLNDIEGVVTTASSTQLMVSFLSGVTTGIISVNVGGVTVQSACDFMIQVTEESKVTIL